MNDKERALLDIVARMLIKEYAGWDARFNKDCEPGFSEQCSHHCPNWAECAHLTKMAEMAEQLRAMVEPDGAGVG